ncbi:MAG: glycoside hydrolase family 2, partial [Defluviitaleaceae bacterium]|nr:glycoside hydrolase family 2 [Defluviitaleaceae bacterium]
ERLTGVQTLCFVFKLKVHIKGFCFTREAKAFSKIPFASYEQIYGDSYTVNDTAVESIGNNVTIDFEHMDFESHANFIDISWRSKLDSNTIRMAFVNKEGDEVVNLLTLPVQGKYDHTRITLDKPLKGTGTVRFIFLPGSDIDLEWFMFGFDTIGKGDNVKEA